MSNQPDRKAELLRRIAAILEELDEELDESTEDESTEDESTEDESTEDEGTEDEGTEDEGTATVGPRASFAPPLPPYRELRGYAVDPSFATRLDAVGVSQVTYRLPWEPLEAGPVGEYLEVIDIDPASDCFYEAVCLDDPVLLAQDGLAPSEGTPQFHQQMVYSVCSLTIHNFERGLGRKVLWRPGPPAPNQNKKDDSHYVQR